MLTPRGTAPRPSFADIAVVILAAPAVRGIIATVVFLAIAAIFVDRAMKTHFFGAFTIVRYPYYRELVADVVRDPAFVRHIGAPIVVDDAGVWCPQIAVAAIASTSECHLPVRGPLGSGDVIANSRFAGGHLSANLTFRSTSL